jgi:hypothetical protein
MDIPSAFKSRSELEEYLGGIAELIELPSVRIETTFAEKDEEIERLVKEYSADTSIVKVKRKGCRWTPEEIRPYIAIVTPVRLKFYFNGYAKDSGLSTKLSDY